MASNSHFVSKIRSSRSSLPRRVADGRWTDMRKYERFHTSLLRNPSRILCGGMVRMHVSHARIQRSGSGTSTSKLLPYDYLDGREIHRFVHQNIRPAQLKLSAVADWMVERSAHPRR